jgi:hypothetical protein
LIGGLNFVGKILTCGAVSPTCCQVRLADRHELRSLSYALIFLTVTVVVPAASNTHAPATITVFAFVHAIIFNAPWMRGEVELSHNSLDSLVIKSSHPMPAWLLLDATEGAIQRQFRRIERLNRLDAQVRHAGIKPRRSGNEKREEFNHGSRSAGRMNTDSFIQHNSADARAGGAKF